MNYQHLKQLIADVQKDEYTMDVLVTLSRIYVELGFVNDITITLDSGNTVSVAFDLKKNVATITSIIDDDNVHTITYPILEDEWEECFE